MSFKKMLVLAVMVAASVVCGQSGTTGPLTWSIEDGTLTISGEGAMPDYDWDGTPPWPWHQYRNSFTIAVIEDGVTTIGDRAFNGYAALTSVTIGNSVTTIGHSAFARTGLTEISIPNSVMSIRTFAFEWTRLTSVIIPNSVTAIGGWAFFGTRLTEITIPNSVTFIGYEAFSSINLTAINVSSESPAFSSEDGVLFNKEKTTLMRYPRGKQGTSYTIPNSVTTIGQSAFEGTRLTSATIPNSVITIGNVAFGSSVALRSVTIGNSVTTIGNRVFEMTGLTSVTNYANIPQTITSNVFTNVSLSGVTLYVPHQSVELYRTADVWRDFRNIVGVDGETSIRNNQPRDNRYGILLENAIVSDMARISVITPEPATVNLMILDNLGNVVFSADNVGATALGRPQQTPIVWNLTNPSGRFVANGTYLIIVEATGICGRRYTYSSRIGVNR